jgi:twitching motility protein PilJ
VQQVAATGQALSQRLAKSVSQALWQSQAFPDVCESAGVLAKTVRGLRDGDSESASDARRKWVMSTRLTLVDHERVPTP